MIRDWQAEPVHGAPRCRLGESPVWDDHTRALHWIDIDDRRLHTMDDLGIFSTIQLSQTVTSIGAWREFDLVGSCANGFATVDLITGQVSSKSPRLAPQNGRMNDGACDPRGRYWAGSLSDEGATASLWMMDTEGEIALALTGITESNGLAWMPDSPDTFYFVDTAERRVDIVQVDAGGQLVRREAFIHFGPGDGDPDGLTLDAGGGLWVAMWGTGQVLRFTSSGDLVGAVHVDEENVTNSAFVQIDGKWQLFITAARDSEPFGNPGALQGAPLFVANVEAAGAPTLRWRPNIQSRKETN